MSTSECVLGIDIGTTSVKCCLVDVNSREVISSQKKDTYSDVPSELGKIRSFVNDEYIYIMVIPV